MIIVFGSINLDIEMHLDRLPSAGETVLGAGYVLSPGGKGANQALAARRAGAEVRLFGCVGRDEFADPALALLREADVNLAGVRAVDRPTGLATVLVDAGGENAIAVASGANLAAKAEQIPVPLLGHDTLLVLQMETPDRENWALIERAAARSARVLLNLAPAGMVPPATLRKVDYLVVNEGEGLRLARELDLDITQPRAIPQQILRQFGPVTIMTLGGAGLICAAPGGGWVQPALPVAASDTTGAGDAATGAFAAALGQGLDLPMALRWAAVAGSLACTRDGAQNALPTRAEIEAALPNLPVAQPFG